MSDRLNLALRSVTDSAPNPADAANDAAAPDRRPQRRRHGHAGQGRRRQDRSRAFARPMARAGNNQGTAKMVQAILRRMALAALALVAVAAADVPLSAAHAQSATMTAGAIHRTVKVGLNKSVIVDLPRDARDILVSNPAIADAVIRTSRRIYITGVAVGQSNVIVFDRAGEQVVSLDLEVERDTAGLSRDAAPPDPRFRHQGRDRQRQHRPLRLGAQRRRRPPGPGHRQHLRQWRRQQLRPAGRSASRPAAAPAAAASPSASPTSSASQPADLAGGQPAHHRGRGSGPPQGHRRRGPAQHRQAARHRDERQHQHRHSSRPAPRPASCSTTGNPFGVNGSALSSNALTLGYSDGVSSLSATLRALEQTGMIRTLAEPTLTAISGETASFLAGGEFPVPTGRDQQGNITIEFKPFGVALELHAGRPLRRPHQPARQDRGVGAHHRRLRSPSTASPSRASRCAAPRARWSFPPAARMVLGGMLQDSVRQSIGKFPGLGDLPILGPLFRSRDFQRNETELVIIITPYLVKPVARSALATPDAGYRHRQRRPGEFPRRHQPRLRRPGCQGAGRHLPGQLRLHHRMSASRQQRSATS